MIKTGDQDNSDGHARVQIEEALRNVPSGGPAEVEIVTTNGDSRCQYRLSEGERYVFITSGTAPYRIDRCSGTFQLRGNEHRLESLRAQVSGGSPSLLSGLVQQGSAGGLSGVTVLLKRRAGHAQQYTEVTDAQGVFRFSGLPVGWYSVVPSKPGYLAKPVEIYMPAKGCNTSDLTMSPAGTIQGTVRAATTAKPVAKVRVQAFALDEAGKPQLLPVRTAITGEDGRYAMEVPAARYRVAVNGAPNRDDDPYPPAIHNGGNPVHVSQGNTTSGIDLAVGEPRTKVAVRFRVLAEDGKPVLASTLRLETKDGKIRWETRNAHGVNAMGEIVARGYAGEEYRAIVSNGAGINGRFWYSEGSATVKAGTAGVTTINLTRRLLDQ